MEGEYEITIRVFVKKVEGGPVKEEATPAPKKGEEKKVNAPQAPQAPAAKRAAKQKVKEKEGKERGRIVERLIKDVVDISTPKNTWVRTPQSTNIAGYFYFQSSKKLCIEFKGGEIYTYHNVPEDVYEEFGRAPSVGKAFHGLIRRRYSHTVGLPTKEEREEANNVDV